MVNFKLKIKKVFAKVTIALVLFISSLPAFANREICSLQHGLATSIMTMRQNNISIVEVFELNKQFQTIQSFADALTVLAYERPLFRVQVNKDEEITRFANEVFLACMRART